MKKSIALVAFLGSALFSSVAFGQTTASSVKLNVNLYPMIAIKIGTGENNPLVGAGVGENLETEPIESNESVTLEYKTAEDYVNGVSAERRNHLTIFSTGSFALSAKVQSSNDVVTAESIRLLVANQGALPDSNENAIQLAANATPLVRNGVAGKNQVFDVRYIGAGNNEYITGIKNNAKTEINTTVIYSVIVN